MTNMNNSDFVTFLRFVESGDLLSIENQFKPEYLEMENENSLRIIHKAVEMGHLEIVKFFHKKKCNLEVSDKNGLRPIHYASGGGHLNILQYLIENNCDKEACDNTDKTPLLYACDGNHIDIVEFLLKCGAKIRTSDKDGRGPIHYACRGGFVDLVKKLCENHCSIEQTDNYGWRPIHYVSRSGMLELVEYLDGRNCQLEIKDQEKEWTPMHHACYGGHLNVVCYLQSRNCSINVTDKNGLTALDLSKDLNNETMINLFVKAKMSLTIEERIQNAKNHSCGNSCDELFCFNKTFSEKSLKNIGEGSFGDVYKIRDQTTNVDIAVKILDLKFQSKAKYIEDDINLYKEILNHKNIVRYYGSYMQGNHYYIFMEYAPGRSLGKAIKKSGPVKHSQIIRYCGQVLEGLDYLHKHQIIHRNVKPKKILLFPNDCIKLCGFAFSRLIEAISNNEDDNETHKFVGLPNYMAPEVILGEKYGYSVDIWSLGACIVRMLTGKHPYSKLKRNQVIFKIGNEKTIEFQPCEPISAEFDNFLREMLNPNPSQRPTATDLLQRLSKMTF